MYNFIDVTGTAEGALLPSEALQINGEYIENIVPGYRTLHVSGREALSPEISVYETGARDGSTIQNRRFPARTITVAYQLIAANAEDFREAYNKLGGVLNVQDAILIFNDEKDKFFRGTPSLIDEVEPGLNAVTGTIEFYCADPFKYSTVEYIAEPSLSDGSILLNYGGTYKAFPTLEADFYEESEDGTNTLTGNGDCGYVAFFNEDEKIIQLGDPEEQDSESIGTVEKSQTLTNQLFLSETAWGTTAKSLWTVNGGDVLPADVQKTGAVAMKVASTSTNAAAGTSATILSNAKSTGSAPVFYYTVAAKTSNRTQTSVKVDFVITASLRAAESYIGTGRIVVGSVYVGGSWHDVTIKKSADNWRGNAGHTVNLSVTVTGLTENSTALSGVKFKAYRSDSSGTSGTLGETACSNIPIKTYSQSVAGNYYLAASDYGTGTGWHGSSISRTIAADSTGVVGAKDFLFTSKQKVCIGSGANDVNQLGGYHIHLSAADGTVIAGLRVVKNQSGKAASLMLFVDGQKVQQVGIDLSHNNKYFGKDYVDPTIDAYASATFIRKTGNEIVFNISGEYRYRHVISNTTAAKVVTKITIMFEKYGSSTPLSYNGLFWAKFTKDNCSNYRDIPNKFGANDVVKADCKNGEIYLNGVRSPYLGALGNDWEGFYLKPGLNQIGFSYSDWVPSDYVPKFKVKYREVFL